MRVRILRGPSAGRVVDVPDPEARALLKQGLVEEDTALDGPTETTGEPGAVEQMRPAKPRRARQHVRA
jgi:hypothetical protein